jgi:hypothetical protein
MSHGTRLPILVARGALGLLVLTLATPALATDYCYGAMDELGPRACDQLSSPADCAQCSREHDPSATIGSWEMDFNTYSETGMYLLELDFFADDADYLHFVPLGDSAWMNLDIGDVAETSAEPVFMYAVRITENAEDASQKKPAILLNCGVHAHEWLPQETCLGLVDYFVKAA